MRNAAPRITFIGAIVAAAGAGVLFAGGGTASAATDVCAALPGQSSVVGECSATADSSAIAAAIADGGGGKAVADSSKGNLSGPAAIALGPGASAYTAGKTPGLAISIAGAGATVTVPGPNGPRPTCDGGLGFGGDFQTGTGCINLGNGNIPLG